MPCTIRMRLHQSCIHVQDRSKLGEERRKVNRLAMEVFMNGDRGSLRYFDVSVPRGTSRHGRKKSIYDGKIGFYPGIVTVRAFQFCQCHRSPSEGCKRMRCYFVSTIKYCLIRKRGIYCGTRTRSTGGSSRAMCNKHSIAREQLSTQGHHVFVGIWDKRMLAPCRGVCFEERKMKR